MQNMTSVEAVTTQDDDDFDSSEYSIIPEINHDPPPEVNQQEAPSTIVNSSNNNFNLMNMTATPTAQEIDSTVNDLSQHLCDLLHENAQLKETLKKNNELMQEKIVTVQQWRDQQMEIKSKLEKELKDANDLVLSYKKQNEELNKQLIQLKNETENFKSKDNTTVLTDEENGYEVIHQNKNLEQEALTQALLQLHEAQNELQQLKEKTNEETSMLEKGALQQTLSELEDAKNEIKHLKNQNEQYLITFELLTQNKKESESKINQLEEKIKILETSAKSNVKVLQEKLAKYETDLKQDTFSENQLISDLKEKICFLDEKLKREKFMNEDYRNNLSEALLNLEKSKTECERLSQLISIQRRDQDDKLASMESQHQTEAKQSLEKIDNLTAKFVDMEQQLEEKEEIIKSLMGKIENVKEESELIPIFKNQIQIYKSDMEKLEADKNSALRELNEVKNELKLLQESTNMNSLDGRSRKFRGRKSETPSVVKNELVECPMCRMEFSSVYAAQNHANSCLDQAEGK